MIEHQDVPSSVDFQNEAHVRTWIEETNVRRPWRPEVFAEFVHQIRECQQANLRVLELGNGPGLLAEQILEACPSVVRYTALDFSGPMLRLSRERLARWPGRVEFVQRDFREDSWMTELGTFEFVVTLQAVHEVRHKSRVPRLYGQVANILRPGGVVLVCDHLPGSNATEREVALFMTQQEQLDALTCAGLKDAAVVFAKHDLGFFRACQPEVNGRGHR